MRGVFRSTWFSALLGLWYALVAMPALPVLSFGSTPPMAESSCVVVCACVSCAGGEACCCANKPGAEAAAEIAQTGDGPAWAPVDCAKKAAWLAGLQAQTLPTADAAIPLPSLPIGSIRAGAEQARALNAVGVPEPPPRSVA